MSEPVTLFRHVDRVEPNRRAITLYDTVLPRPPWTGTITEGRWLPADEFATLTRERDEAVKALAFYASGRTNAFRCASESIDLVKGTGPCCERVIDAGGIARDVLERRAADGGTPAALKHPGSLGQSPLWSEKPTMTGDPSLLRDLASARTALAEARDHLAAFYAGAPLSNYHAMIARIDVIAGEGV